MSRGKSLNAFELGRTPQSLPQSMPQSQAFFPLSPIAPKAHHQKTQSAFTNFSATLNTQIETQPSH